MQEALADLAVLQDEKKEWEFREELKTINEINVRPVTPSKIPVGSWRVEEEKELNRALAGNGLLDSNRSKFYQQFYVRGLHRDLVLLGGWNLKFPSFNDVIYY